MAQRENRIGGIAAKLNRVRGGKPIFTFPKGMGREVRVFARETGIFPGPCEMSGSTSLRALDLGLRQQQ
jgi:hypothetical protein